MDPITWLVIGLVVSVVSNIVTGVIQGATANKVKNDLDAAVDEVAETQAERLEDEYEATTVALEEAKVEAIGQQTQALGFMGQAGGADTAAGGIVENTERRAARDQSLLDQNYENAVADLNAQTALAKAKLQADYETTLANITSNFIAQSANALLDFGTGLAGIPKVTPSPTGGGTLLTRGPSQQFGLGTPMFGLS